MQDSISSAGDTYSSDVENAFLLTCGKAWAISLTLRNTLREELSGVSFPELVNESLDNILYRLVAFFEHFLILRIPIQNTVLDLGIFFITDHILYHNLVIIVYIYRVFLNALLMRIELGE